MNADEQVWTVGRLAAAVGVTVRTLHHYDELGLLSPGARSEAGYRLYDEDDVRRLYRILAFRDLGFPLAEIADLLDADSGSLRAATEAQLERTEHRLAAEGALRDRLVALLRTQRAEGEGPTTDELIDTMEAMSMSVKLTRIYTRKGDAGETRRAGGSTVAKDDPAIEAGGEVDELCAGLGFALSLPGVPDDHVEWLRGVQNDLFDLGAELSVPESSRDPAGPRIDASYVARLEALCDQVNADLAPLDSFLLPGGTSYAAQLQVCRAVCRRAERRVLAGGEASAAVLAYLNRLSDLLFILARAAAPVEEVLWQPGGSR